MNRKLLTSILSSLKEERRRKKVIEQFKLGSEFEDDFAAAFALRRVRHGRFRIIKTVSHLDLHL